MKKCCFIIPYFGKFPNYFSLFLKTCAWNQDFYWMVITDSNEKYEYPKNFMVIKMTFEELKKLVQSKFNFKIALDNPYKLCDYKPAYGYIFEEYLPDFNFWGHCDVDTLIGNLGKFITEEMFATYDKIFCLGHMTLYRNTYENNRVFMSPFNNVLLYKSVFSNNKICWFDEEWKNESNINELFIYMGKKVFIQDLSLNFSIFKSQLVKTTYVGHTDNADAHGYILESHKKCLYLWNKGSIQRYYIENGQLINEEFPYMHLQKRNMYFRKELLRYDTIRITANYFLKLRNQFVDDGLLNKIKEYPNLQYFYIYFLPKVKRFLRKYGRISI